MARIQSCAQYGGVVVATILFLGCGGPSSDSPAVSQATDVSVEGYSSAVVGLAGAGALAPLSPPVLQPDNPAHPAPQGNMNMMKPSLNDLPVDICPDASECRAQTGSTAIEPAADEYNVAGVPGVHETGPQTVEFPTADLAESGEAVADPAMDEAERIHAHDLGLDQLLREVE